MRQGEGGLYLRFRALMQLVRMPNLLIIVLTQLLLWLSFTEPVFHHETGLMLNLLPDFLILILVTILIAAGGYVINDYFDVKIDTVNRPDVLVVNRVISSRTAIKLHMVINGIAILLGFYLAWRVQSITFGLIFPFISGVLWIYSAKYKRVLLAGNFIVAALSAFVIMIVWLFGFYRFRLLAGLAPGTLAEWYVVSGAFLGYGIFAFMISLVREIVKDMEDTEGDEREGCTTLPIVFGTRTARIAAGLIMFSTIILLAYVQVLLYMDEHEALAWYFLVTVQTGAVFFMIRLFHTEKKRDFHFLSQLCKLIMLAGILSMIVLYTFN